MLQGLLKPDFIRKVSANGKYRDGSGLFLVVRNDGRAKSWVLRYTLDHRPDEMGLGSLRTVDPDEARALAREFLKLAKAGIDPKADRKEAKEADQLKRSLIKTVDEVLDEFLEVSREGRRPGTLVSYRSKLQPVRKAIGHMKVQSVTTRAAVPLLRPIWNRGGSDILRWLLWRAWEYAIVHDYFVGKNPFDMSLLKKAGMQDHGKVRKPIQRRAGLPPGEVGQLVDTLRAHVARHDFEREGRPIISMLTEFIVLTGGPRIMEAAKAEWSQFNFDNMIWTVPWTVHKTGTNATQMPILRPITKSMMPILENAKRRNPDCSHVFPSIGVVARHDAPYSGSGISNWTRNSLKWQGSFFHWHGFRTTFTAWAIRRGYPEYLYEAQLGHSVGDAVAQAYRHSVDSQLVQRRRMMESWDAFCCSDPAELALEQDMKLVSPPRELLLTKGISNESD